ncbi:MAG: glycerol-3-phosphate 1-O-acyltransferase PlsY [Alphaproteobacteria bacterium]|nr:glycerol-3-phosphate 1-O-acyltransferase PlsY [Alphaproteobacteria bacterium]
MIDPISWAHAWPYVLAAFAFGYVLGAIPFGLILTRLAGLGDIRRIGSGNIGATNVLRTGNKGLAAATLLLDAAKGAAAVLLAREYGSDMAVVAAAGAMVGHVFPLWLGFRGGKGVATAHGILLALAWPVGVLACLVWLATAAITRRSSLAALVALAVAPVAAWFLADPQRAELAAAIALLVWVRHVGNLRRLIAGTEPRIGGG